VYGVVALNIGVIAGCIGIGWLAGRTGRPILVIAGAFAFGALATALIGRSGESSTMLYVTAFLAGGLCTGAQICTIALGARIYETALRATGVGWAIGVGRVGSLVGPIVAGVLIGAGMPVPTLFVLVGALSFGSATAVWLLGRAVASPLGRPVLRPKSLPA
jgi:MFS family permease